MVLDNAFKPDLRVKKEIGILHKKGFDINLLCWDRDSNLPKEENINGIKIKRFKIRTEQQLGINQIKFLLRFYVVVFKYIFVSTDQFNFIWVHDYPVLLLGIILKLLLQIPLIYDAHEIYWLMEYEKYPFYIRSFLKYSEILFEQFVDKFITVNELRYRYYKKYYRKKIYIGGNWYAPVRLKRESNSKQSIASKKRFTIGYIGILSKSRELDLLLELAKKRQEISIIIAGKGVEEDYLKMLSSGVKNVKFLGWIENIYSILSKVDALYYVLNDEKVYSHWNSPNALYLAIATNIPLITSNLGESGAVIERVNPQILLKKNSMNELLRVVSLLQDKDFYTSLKKKMLPLQKKYNLERIEEAISSIFS